MNDTNNHDDMLFDMLKECKTLPIFLDHIFGFLQRRTDFYHIASDSNAAVGLPAGLAEKLIQHTFSKWKPADVYYNEEEIPTVQEEVISTERFNEKINQGEVMKSVKTLSIQDPKTNFTSSECYNGAVYEHYSWSQTITDVDIIVKLPEKITNSDLKVVILPNKISVKLKDETLLEGELCQKCKNNDAIWSYEKTKLEIHLDKCVDMWWDSLLKSEPKLDISKIDCSRPFEELPQEAQAKIEELQWNEERKRLGLPTSEQMALQEKLKKAWNLKGSPFTGPYDPNAVIT